jgi:hypothetical protein
MFLECRLKLPPETGGASPPLNSDGWAGLLTCLTAAMARCMLPKSNRGEKQAIMAMKSERRCFYGGAFFL